MSEIIEVGTPLWHQLRATGIGGSDAAAAVGLSKWMTPLQLYLLKRGEAEQTAQTEPMRWGQLHEPTIRKEYVERTGRWVRMVGFMRHPTRPYAVGNVDGLVEDERLLEIKTARSGEGWGTPGTDEIPQEYLMQCQHYLAITGMPAADVVVLIAGNGFRIYSVQADPELQEILLDGEAIFWERVQRGDPPAPINQEDVKRRWRYSSGPAVQASLDVMDSLAELRDLKAAIKEAEEREQVLTARVQGFMRDAAELLAGNTVLATWKNVSAQPKFDLESFKSENPEMFQRYLKEPKPQRRMLLKDPNKKSSRRKNHVDDEA